MAAYTIGYQPQFVQSDIGSIQKRLAEMQSQYDTAYQGQLEAEDAFGNIPVVSQSDAGLRDEVLGGFKNKVQTIVDEYGGDYGAASKRLAKEIIATKSNPFFQLASRKAQLAEEQRKLASQPGSIVLQDVRNVNLRDAHGNYISPDQLGYNVTTRDYLRKELGNAYGNLAKKVREGDYQTLRSTPWLMQKAVTQGITEQEVPAVADDMMGTLKQMYPTLPEDVVQSIATEQASQLVLGTQNKEQANWKYQQDYNFGQQKDMYKWQLDEKARREQPPPPVNPLELYDTEGGTKDVGRIVVKDVIANNKKVLANATKNILSIKNDLDTKVYNAQTKEEVNKNLNKARAEYKRAQEQLAKQFPVYGQMIKMGKSNKEALSTIESIYGDENDQPFYAINYAKTYDENTASRFIDLMGSDNTTVYKLKDGKYEETDYKPHQFKGTESFKGAKRIGFNLADNKAIIKVGDETYAMDINQSSNPAVISAFNKYNKAFNVYSGSEGMGEWALLPSGDIQPINTVKDGRVLDYSQLPPNTEIIQVGYKGDKFERRVLKINAQGIPEKTNFSNKTRGQLNSLFSEIGINIEYPNIKL